MLVVFWLGLRGPKALRPATSMRGTMEVGRASEKSSGKPRAVASKGVALVRNAAWTKRV